MSRVNDKTYAVLDTAIEAAKKRSTYATDSNNGLTIMGPVVVFEFDGSQATVRAFGVGGKLRWPVKCKTCAGSGVDGVYRTKCWLCCGTGKAPES